MSFQNVSGTPEPGATQILRIVTGTIRQEGPAEGKYADTNIIAYFELRQTSLAVEAGEDLEAEFEISIIGTLD